MTRLIGLDIGGTKCAVSHMTADGKVDEVARFATTNVNATLTLLAEAIEQIGPTADSIFGISCGGPLNSERGLILSPPNLPGWNEIPICDYFTSRFGGRAFLMNDANACALAEWQFGAGRGCRHMVFLTSGTGMGAGLILNRQLYEGATHSAGEVGHMRLSPDGPIGFGKAGSFEGFCSGSGITRMARMKLANALSLSEFPAWAFPEHEISTQKIAQAAAQNEPLARQIFQEAGLRLGQALALLVDILNPERIVIGGLFPRCHHLLRPEMERVLKEEALGSSLDGCSIVPAELGETIGSHGAIAAALVGAGLTNHVN